MKWIVSTGELSMKLRQITQVTNSQSFLILNIFKCTYPFFSASQICACMGMLLCTLVHSKLQSKAERHLSGENRNCIGPSQRCRGGRGTLLPSPLLASAPSKHSCAELLLLHIIFGERHPESMSLCTGNTGAMVVPCYCSLPPLHSSFLWLCKFCSPSSLFS